MKRLSYTIVCLVLCSLLNAQDYEQAFHAIQQDFEQRLSATQTKLKKYLDDYPYTPYSDEVWTMQGVLLTEKGNYQEAIKALEKVRVKHLSRTTVPLYYYHRGYAHLQIENYDKALEYFTPLKNKHNNPYTLQASYYVGYCHYSLKEYGQALVEFLSLEQIGGYRKIVPYYIVQIHYAQSEYEKVMERGEKLLVDYPENEYNSELHRMLGEIYYQDSVYDKAADHLEAYHTLCVKKKKDIVRNDLYLLGVSNYKIKNYEKAIGYLKEIKQEADSISENACLHLGHSYLRVNDIEKAKLAYAAAIQFNITPALREEAMYNYVQVTYLQNSALGESITAFQMFIKEYPASKYIDKVYALMADLYLTSKNYQAALDALLEIQQPNEQVLQTRQYLRYQLAVDAYLQNKVADVLNWCNELIINEPKESEYKTEAYYLCAQAQYQLHQYTGCLEQLKLYEAQSNVAQSHNYVPAIYLKGYAEFNLRNYAAAEPILRTYIGKITPENTTYPDALNRVGDCLFHARRFQDACDAYEQVVKQNRAGADYAILQQGYSLGLLHRYPEKITTLQALPLNYPQSDYADDALYEIARAELQQEHHTEAIQIYQTLLTDYPNSNCAAKASLELGMAYRTQKDYEHAIEAFKNTITAYTGSEEAYSALEGLEQIYVETNNINEYIAYTKQLTHLNMQQVSSEDSLVYVTAELQYMLGNHQQAAAGFTTYLTSFCPGGRYCTIATYYAANSFYQLKQYNEAIDQFSALADIQGNPYMEEACMRVAELSYDKQEYRTALYYFQRMSEVASSNAKRTTALLGMLRCGYNLEDKATTLDVATRLLEEPALDSLVRNEALYCRAKAHLQNQQYGLALVDLTPVAKEVRTAQGAEAKYLLATCYYQLGAIDMAEQEIMAFTQKQTSHQYWLAKSLILLADINVDRNELFQAKQYLLALKNNYRAQDNIHPTIEEKLQHIAQLEINQTTDTAQIQQL